LDGSNNLKRFSGNFYGIRIDATGVPTAGQLKFNSGANGLILSASIGIFLSGTQAVAWGSSADSVAQDIFLVRDAAGALADRNGVNAQSFRIYNTFTDASNYERLGLTWASNVMRLGSANAGTGTARVFTLDYGGTTTAAITIPITSGPVTLSDSVTTNSGTAIPAGGTADVGHMFSSTAHFGMFFGSGAPSLSAAKGSLYLRSDGSTTNDRAYINTNGSTTWTALTTAS